MSLMLTCEIHRITIFKLQRVNLHCIITEWSAKWERSHFFGKPWATERMRLSHLCFPRTWRLEWSCRHVSQSCQGWRNRIATVSVYSCASLFSGIPWRQMLLSSLCPCRTKTTTAVLSGFRRTTRTPRPPFGTFQKGRRRETIAKGLWSLSCHRRRPIAPTSACFRRDFELFHATPHLITHFIITSPLLRRAPSRRRAAVVYLPRATADSCK